jgi:hypothetical protein
MESENKADFWGGKDCLEEIKAKLPIEIVEGVLADFVACGTYGYGIAYGTCVNCAMSSNFFTPHVNDVDGTMVLNVDGLGTFMTDWCCDDQCALYHEAEMLDRI